MIDQIILGIGFILICYYIIREINREEKRIELAMQEIGKGKRNEKKDYIFVGDDDKEQDDEDIGEEHAGMLASNEEEETEALYW